MRRGRLAHKHTLALSLAAYGHEVCTDAPKALKLLRTFRGRALPRVKAKMHEKR